MKTFAILAIAIVLAEGGYEAIAQQGSGSASQTHGQTMGNGQMSQQMRDQMMAHMKEARSSDAKLGTLVEKMNHATGSKKVDAIAAVVRELASENKSMCSMMGMGMGTGMMGNMGSSHVGGSGMMGSGGHGQMMGNGQMNQQMRDQMMAHMKEVRSSDAKLGALVEKMNHATGSKKVDAIAAVVRELASENKSMCSMMGMGMVNGTMGNMGSGHKSGPGMMGSGH